MTEDKKPKQQEPEQEWTSGRFSLAKKLKDSLPTKHIKILTHKITYLCFIVDFCHGWKIKVGDLICFSLDYLLEV